MTDDVSASSPTPAQANPPAAAPAPRQQGAVLVMSPGQRLGTWCSAFGAVMIIFGAIAALAISPAYDLAAGGYGDEAKEMNWPLFSQWAIGGVIVIVVGLAGATIAQSVSDRASLTGSGRT